MMHLALLIALTAVCLVGVVGNILIIGSVILYRRIRVRGNAFIINLAIADLITVAYIMPVGLVSSQYEGSPLGQLMCQINAFLALTSLGVSTQTLMFIALERYFHICNMPMYKKVFTPKLIALYIFFIWAYTSAWTCQGWTGWTTYAYSELCFVCLYNGGKSYSLCLGIFGLIIPMIVLGLCYFRVFKAVILSRKTMDIHRKSKRNSKDSSQLTKSESEKQSIKEYQLIVTLFSIVVVFFVCWLPACIILGLSDVVHFPQLFAQIAIWLAFSNSSLNSIIYGLLNKNFRKGYLVLISVIVCCGFNNIDKESTSFIGKKVDSSSQEPQQNRKKTLSKSLSSESDGLETRKSEPKAKDSAQPLSTIQESNTNYQSMDNHDSQSLQTVSYANSPFSETPSKTHMDQSEPDKLKYSALLRTRLVSSGEDYFTSSASGSQSSLIHRYSQSDGYSLNGHSNEGINDHKKMDIDSKEKLHFLLSSDSSLTSIDFLAPELETRL